ncbi:peptidylprolyl isomerase [Thiorhodococcus minor]|uniref:peptidylprolyl isomerase n=1 Tax=Thiorhodococcus minor TaxID=57489 RepID=A0A6M0K0N7_9GAMM|nr:peptidylprolyl isomerase [Thiorhodococcus minor]NEV63338.1 peptidylprolyl isomerase [Thiorhodococcus minor]
MNVIRINDEVIDSDAFVKLLKLTGRFNALLEDIVKEKVASHAALRQNLPLTEEEVQERADDLRRVRGLHRAADMNRYLDTMGVSLEEFEQYIVEMLRYEKMMAEISNDTAIEEYFRLNSPKFDAISVSHIMVDSEGKAREIISILEEEPEAFEELVEEYSLADTRNEAGRIGRVLRGALPPEVEGKIFNAAEGAILGPFATVGDTFFEVFRIDQKESAQLSESTKEEVKRRLREEWFATKAREHRVEVL